ncbi:hypothetical protein DFJ74DRAFT_195992 [Hyaloraphidium curvatum]|nr:hypothetical protein DFJ74DRAFT_195992 [Hyaloraphidium curvatum]
MALNADQRAAHAETLSKEILDAHGYSDATPLSRVPNIFKPSHCHPFDAMGIVFGGRFRVRTDDNVFDCTRISQPFFVPSMTLHTEETWGQGAMMVIGRKWPEGDLEQITEGKITKLPQKSEEVVGSKNRL